MAGGDAGSPAFGPFHSGLLSIPPGLVCLYAALGALPTRAQATPCCGVVCLKLFHHKAKEHAHKDQSKTAAAPCNWSCGGIVADPAGTGKTVMAIAFCLLSKKLKLFHLPTFVFVKTLIASQYINKIHCFVNVGAKLEVVNLTSQSFDLKKISKELKQDTTRWKADIVFVAPSKMVIPKGKGKEELISMHKSNL